jgi:hypothetical protein
MPIRPLLSTLLLLSLLVLDLPAAHADEWEDLGETDGVRVSRMEVTGSSMLAFRGEMVADLHISRLMAIFLDPDDRASWVGRYHSHGTLERVERPDDNEMWERYWIRFDLPRGISDRDYVLRTDLEVDRDDKVVVARIRSVVDRRWPEQECCVRAATESYYRFTAVPGQNRTRIIVEIHTDPKGRLPAWLVNRIQRSWPSSTLSSLVSRAGESDVTPRSEFVGW